MDTFFTILLFALFGGGFVGILYLGHQRLKADHEARALLAARRGWRYATGRGVNFSIDGEAQGWHWRFDYVTEKRGKKVHRSAHWCAPALAAPRLVWLVAGRQRVSSESGLAAQFLAGLLSLRLPGERADADDRQAFIQNAREQPAPALATDRSDDGDGFIVLALPALHGPDLDDDLARRLQHWPTDAARRPGSARGTRLRLSAGPGGLRIDRRGLGRFSPADQVELRWDSQGLHVHLHEPPADALSCEHAIDLGLALLLRVALLKRAA